MHLARKGRSVDENQTENGQNKDRGGNQREREPERVHDGDVEVLIPESSNVTMTVATFLNFN